MAAPSKQFPYIVDFERAAPMNRDHEDGPHLLIDIPGSPVLEKVVSQYKSAPRLLRFREHFHILFKGF